MKVYALDINGLSFCEVDIEHRPWMPVKPRISSRWMRFFLARALQHYFRSADAVVKA